MKRLASFDCDAPVLRSRERRAWHGPRRFRPLRALGPCGVRARLLAGLLLLAGCGVSGELEVGDRGAQPGSTAWPLWGEAETAQADGGMVVTGHPLASRVGAEVLADGGNAVDAAVAVGMALAAVLPEAGNLGGGGFMVYRAPDGEVVTLDYRETAPAAAHRDMFLDEDGEPTDRSVTGALAAGVPGSVAGMWAMHQGFGSRPWPELLQPAVELAREHTVDAVRARHLANGAERLAAFEASARQFLPGGRPPEAGETLRQPDLAHTLELLRDGGPGPFYDGEIAERIVAEMERGGGIITREDLRSYEPVWRDPVVADYRGHTLFSMGPPSSGGVTLALLLNVLEGFEQTAPPDSVLGRHRLAETMRLAFIDRNRYLGDPDFVDVPVEQFQDQDHADGLRTRIDDERAGVTPVYVGAASEGTNTTHYSIVDPMGGVVAVTTTINTSYGSAVTVAGAGFLLNNEMDDFATAPGRPNVYGLVEGESNAVEPGKRMLSSMTPTVLLDPAGELLLVLGSPGGPTIITSVLQVIHRVLDHGAELATAIEAPRIHHQALPDAILYERGGLDAGTIAALRALGHELREREGRTGDVQAILRRPDGVLLGVSDPRRGGAPVGVRRPD